MRFAAIAVLSVTLFAAPAMAAIAGSSTPASSAEQPHNFGGANCMQKIPCPDSSDSVSPDAYAGYGNACVVQYLGFQNSDGFFEKYKGLDSNGCLTTRPNVLPKLTSTRTEPHCCITQAADKSCMFHCDIVTVP
jgi:hypothetical protein